MSEDQTHCMICLDKCLTPGTLHLLCECKYKVHYRCYLRWYKLNPTCIICHEFAFPPSKKGKHLDPLSMAQWRRERRRSAFPPWSDAVSIMVSHPLVNGGRARMVVKRVVIILCLGLILLSLELLFPFFPSRPRLKEGLIIAILITLSTLWFGRC